MAIRKAIVLESDFITNNLILARTYKGSKIKYIRKSIVLESDFITNNLILTLTYKGSKIKYIRKSVVMMQDKKISKTIKRIIKFTAG